MSRRVSKAIRAGMVRIIQTDKCIADIADQYAVSTTTIYGWLYQKNRDDDVVSGWNTTS